ncbi:MAG: F0F1 ATP synthase subunit A [Berryella intestinalis]|uniref:F0F1 ATP synthase subunit A n=1 Tax=Berryella intestinalis TaxID=1531429 RepID=UPI002A76209A|nr:F0F1 ATP synthase subunit A [Berryella intestinalis]MDY3129528.1 F0F1 ATP synthase subunit A [Berryella intestinalis]
MNPLDLVNHHVPELKESFDSAFVANFGSGIGITQYVLWLCITCALTLIVVLVAAQRLTLVPNNRFVNMIETGYQFVRRDMGEGTIGHGYKKHVPFLATMFFFILISNMVGLIPGCKTPTGSISITWALSLIAFAYFNYWGVKAHGGWGYIKSIAPSGLPAPMVPVIWFFEFLSLVLRALTLAVRLYGNMFAGHMALGVFSIFAFSFIQSVIEGAMPLVGGVSILWMALLVAMYALETLVAFLQAYVFTVLSAVYIQLATSEH